MQDYYDGTHFECMTNYGFTHVSFVRNVARVWSVVGLVNFLMGKLSAKAKTHHLGKFAHWENNPPYCS